MPLAEAFGLNAVEVVACVGAGGKTTTCWRLWSEWKDAGRAVILCTTTHIVEPILPDDAALMLCAEPDAQRVRQTLSRTTGLILARTRVPDAPDDSAPNPVAPALPRKLAGVSPRHLDALIARLPEATWIVEADGARGRSLKMPADHEPAIPKRATVVAVLAGLDAIGQPVDESTVHRAALFARRLGIMPGDIVTAGHVTRALCDPLGGLKGIPPGARVVAVLNQIDTANLHPDAGAIARGLLATGRYERVLVASLRADYPVLKVFGSLPPKRWSYRRARRDRRDP